jgi:hypothetical protein
LGLAYLTIGDRGSALDQYQILKNLDNNLAIKLFDLIYNEDNGEGYLDLIRETHDEIHAEPEKNIGDE